MPIPQDGQVSALVALITTAAQTIEKHYSQVSSKPYVPSLNDTEPHPLDGQSTAPDLRTAIQTLEGACAQLCTTVAKPQHVMMNKLMEIFEATSLQIAIQHRITDLLEKSGPQGMHISEMAAQLGLDQNKLMRVMRLLALKHVYTEVEEDVFANNRLSMTIHSKKALSPFGLYFLEDNRMANLQLPDVLADPVWGPSRDPRRSPFSKYIGAEKGLFEWYATPEGAKRGARFGIGMMAWAEVIEAEAVVTGFPWHELPEGTSVCDVGSGIGTISMALAKEHPHLRLKLQDMPKTIKQAQEEVWPQMCSEAIANEGRVEFHPIDFLQEAPIKDCDIYFMKNIIHNWPDSECVTILKNIKSAMKPDSRILIHEHVLTTMIRQAHSEEIQAPEPLLANFGAGGLRPYALDHIMLSTCNSEERSLKHYIKLGEHAGLKFTKLWTVGEMGLVELRLN